MIRLARAVALLTVATAGLLTCFSTRPAGAETTADELVQALQKRYDSIKDF